MDVTRQIRRTNLKYGASDNTNPLGYSAAKTLNLAKGPSISRPDNLEVSVIPYALTYRDAVGLMGTENYYLKVTINVIGDIVKEFFEEEGWGAAELQPLVIDNTPSYLAAEVEYDEVEDDTNYNETEFPEVGLPAVGAEEYLSVELTNNGTGNIYVDNHLNVRLYTRDREEHPYDLMYISRYDYFYIGVHARNTRVLPYDFTLKIGGEYRDVSRIEDKRYIMKSNNRISY